MILKILILLFFIPIVLPMVPGGVIFFSMLSFLSVCLLNMICILASNFLALFAEIFFLKKYLKTNNSFDNILQLFFLTSLFISILGAPIVFFIRYASEAYSLLFILILETFSTYFLVIFIKIKAYILFKNEITDLDYSLYVNKILEINILAFSLNIFLKLPILIYSYLRNLNLINTNYFKIFVLANVSVLILIPTILFLRVRNYRKENI